MIAKTKKKVAKRKKVVTKKKAAPKKKRGRVGGRAPGTPNKNSQKTSLLEYARKIGRAPAEILIEVANGKEFEDGSGNIHKPTAAEMIQAAKDAAPYCHPKLRSTEIKGEIIPATFICKNA